MSSTRLSARAGLAAVALVSVVVLGGATSAAGRGEAAGDAGGGIGIEAGSPPHNRAVPTQGGTRIEYIAHAAFIIESPGGTRIAIDPYNGYNWLGYAFPEGIQADAVLVSHPHFDHDATYYFSNLTPVFRVSGEYRVDDVTIRGVGTEHVGRARFVERGQTPWNTVWIVEAGGLRVAHLGDSRLLNELDLETIGPVDVLLIGAAYFEASNAEMMKLLLDTMSPSVMIPMHYRHPEISDLPGSLRPVDEYLRGHDFRRVDGNVVGFNPDSLSDDPEVVVLAPSPAVEPWSDAVQRAWIEAGDGDGLLDDAASETDPGSAEESLWEGLSHYEAAMDLAPTVLAFGYGAGDALARLGRVDEAIETLDHALARAARGDWTDRLRVHLLLGELYEGAGHTDIAIEHYAYVAAQQHTHETRLRERAVAKLAELR